MVYLQIKIALNNYFIEVFDIKLARQLKKAFAMLGPEIVFCEDKTLSPIFSIDNTEISTNSYIGELISFINGRIESQLMFDYKDMLLLHGSCVQLNGVAVCILAPTNTGKSTLALYLCNNGFSYNSDDIIVINDVSVPIPVRLPLEIRNSFEISNKLLQPISIENRYYSATKIGITNLQYDDSPMEKMVFLFLDNESHNVEKTSGAECYKKILLSLKTGGLTSKKINKINNLVHNTPCFSMGRLDFERQYSDILKICNG